VQGIGGFRFGSLIHRFRRMQHDLDRIRPVRGRRRRRRRPGSKGAAGPKLVRGRGLAGHRAPSGFVRLLPYLLLGAGLTVVLFKYVVVPFLSR
jgi:hypothetical protein